MLRRSASLRARVPVLEFLLLVLAENAAYTDDGRDLFLAESCEQIAPHRFRMN